MSQSASLLDRSAYDKCFKTVTTPWFIGFFMLLVVCSFIWVDRPLTAFCASIKHVQATTYTLQILTLIGENKIYLVLFPVLTFLFGFVLHQQIWARRFFFLWLCVLLPDVINLILKVSFSRARPELFLDSGIYGFQWFKMAGVYWSFPSGHATRAMGLAFGLWQLFPRYRKLFFVIACIVPLTRIFLLRHFLSDVVVATYLAFIEVWLIGYFWQIVEQKYQMKA